LSCLYQKKPLLMIHSYHINKPSSYTSFLWCLCKTSILVLINEYHSDDKTTIINVKIAYSYDLGTLVLSFVFVSTSVHSSRKRSSNNSSSGDFF
jgi:hypothetical protein